MSRLRSSLAVPLCALAVLALSACKPPSNEPTSYDDVTEANFIEGCTGVVTQGTGDAASTSIVNDQGADPDVCKCEYDWFVANVPFDSKAAATTPGPDGVNFQQLNQQLQDNPDSMPQDIQDSLRQACGPGAGTPGATESQTGTSVAPPENSVIEATTTSAP